MRTILFRGKDIKTGEFVYGAYIESFKSADESRKHWILRSTGHNGNWFFVYDRCQVDPETVGQFTGLKDKNGKEIYEGDFVIINGETTLYLDETTIKGQEVFYENGAFWCAWSDGVDTYGGDALLADIQTKNIEIIGNIHESVK